MGDGHDDESEGVFPDEYDGSTVKNPRVDAPDIDVVNGDADAVVDSPIADLFVLQVIVWNAVLLCFSVGVMLIYFQRDWVTGGQLIAVSIALALYGAYRWPDTDDRT